MRRSVFTLAIAIIAFLSAAQDKAQQERVKQIRQQYAEAQQTIRDQQEEVHLCHTLEVKRRTTEGGVGVVEYTATFYSVTTELEDADGNYSETYAPFFVRTKREFKEAIIPSDAAEYMFDPETGKLVFCFVKRYKYEDQKNMYEEQRLYFDADGKLCHQKAEIRMLEDNSLVTTFVANEDYARTKSDYLMKLFTSLMNEAGLSPD